MELYNATSIYCISHIFTNKWSNWLFEHYRKLTTIFENGCDHIVRLQQSVSRGCMCIAVSWRWAWHKYYPLRKSKFSIILMQIIFTHISVTHSLDWYLHIKICHKFHYLSAFLYFDMLEITSPSRIEFERVCWRPLPARKWVAFICVILFDSLQSKEWTKNTHVTLTSS